MESGSAHNAYFWGRDNPNKGYYVKRKAVSRQTCGVSFGLKISGEKRENIITTPGQIIDRTREVVDQLNRKIEEQGI